MPSSSAADKPRPTPVLDRARLLGLKSTVYFHSQFQPIVAVKIVKPLAKDIDDSDLIGTPVNRALIHSAKSRR